MYAALRMSVGQLTPQGPQPSVQLRITFGISYRLFFIPPTELTVRVRSVAASSPCWPEKPKYVQSHKEARPHEHVVKFGLDERGRLCSS